MPRQRGAPVNIYGHDLNSCDSAQRGKEPGAGFSQRRLGGRSDLRRLRLHRRHGPGRAQLPGEVLRPAQQHGGLRQQAVRRDQAGSDWIFILDADEEISPALRAELKRFTASSPAAAARLPRRNYYFGRWLKHGGKYPDAQLRLFRRGRARFAPLPVHERLDVDGPVEELKEPLLHYPYSDAADMEKKAAFYAEILARSYALKGRNRLFLLLRPFSRFLAAYFLKLGFLDGAEGLRTAAMDFRTVMASALRYIGTKK